MMSCIPEQFRAPRTHAPLIWRIARRIDKRGPDECWPWIGANVGGYGNLGHQGKIIKATRALWRIARGQIPEGYGVCHTCDNPPCMNMRHWFLGTQRDNALDRAAKGRGGGAKIAGSRNKHAKLDESRVSEIKRALAHNEHVASIAARHGVSLSTIYSIKCGRVWRRVG